MTDEEWEKCKRLGGAAWVLAEIHELADEKSKTPLQDRQLIRIKAQVALRQAAKSGLLS